MIFWPWDVSLASSLQSLVLVAVAHEVLEPTRAELDEVKVEKWVQVLRLDHLLQRYES